MVTVKKERIFPSIYCLFLWPFLSISFLPKSRCFKRRGFSWSPIFSSFVLNHHTCEASIADSNRTASHTTTTPTNRVAIHNLVASRITRLIVHTSGTVVYKLRWMNLRKGRCRVESETIEGSECEVVWSPIETLSLFLMLTLSVGPDERSSMNWLQNILERIETQFFGKPFAKSWRFQ